MKLPFFMAVFLSLSSVSAQDWADMQKKTIRFYRYQRAGAIELYRVTKDKQYIDDIKTLGANASIMYSLNGQLSLHLPEVHNYSTFALVGMDGRIVQSGMISGNKETITLDKLAGGMWL